MSSVRIAAYTIRVMGKHPDLYPNQREFDDANQAVVNKLPDALADAEKVLNEWLPTGFYCKIES